MEKLFIWAIIIGGISLFRLIRRLRGEVNAAARTKSMARMNAAAERILAKQGGFPAPQSAKQRSIRKQSTGKPARNRPAGAGAAQPRPSRGSAVIRLSTPVTSGAGVVQRRC